MGKPVKTETIVRTYDAEGLVLSEKITTEELKSASPTNAAPGTGMYL